MTVESESYQAYCHKGQFDLQASVAALLSRMRASNSVTLSTIGNVIDGVTSVIGEVVQDVKLRVTETMQTSGVNLDDDMVQELLKKMDE